MLTNKEKKHVASILKFTKKLNKGDDKAYALLDEFQPEEMAYSLMFLIRIIKEQDKEFAQILSLIEIIKKKENKK